MAVAEAEDLVLSTCEAEYIAAATSACQVVWPRQLMEEITGEEESTPSTLIVGNQLGIALTKNSVLHDWSKHINMKFHFLRNCVVEGKIVIKFVDTGRQLADCRAYTPGTCKEGRRRTPTRILL
jgi:hypothetical protein